MKKKSVEEQIYKVFERTGKTDSTNSSLIAGLVGIKAVLKNAKAVVRGMAEPEMCITLHAKTCSAEVGQVIETSPNGVVVLNM